MSLVEFDFSTTSLSEAMITASQSIRSDFPAEYARNQLSALVDEARAEISLNWLRICSLSN